MSHRWDGRTGIVVPVVVFLIVRLESEAGKVRSLPVSHSGEVFGRLIVAAHKVQRAVDHVEQQLVGSRPAEAGGRRSGRVGTDDHLGLQTPPGTLQLEAEHVGGVVAVEELAIQPADGGIVDYCQADLGLVDGRLFEDPSHGTLQPAFVDRERRLLVGDVDRDHF